MKWQRCKSLMLVLVLAGCGGKGGDDEGPAPTGGSDPPTPVVTSVRVGDATISKTLQPGVVELAEGEAQSSGVTTLQVTPSRASLAAGNVITWKDRAYVVTGVAPVTGGGAQLTVRDASYSEVLSDLTVSGDLDMSNIDTGQIQVAVDSGVSTASFIDTRSPPPIRTLATTFKGQTCEGSIGERVKGETSEIKCAVFKRDETGAFEIRVDVGVRDLFARGVNVRPFAGEVSIDNFSVTPFLRVSASVLDDSKETKNIEKKFPIISISLPLTATYGLVSVSLPVSMEVVLPLFKFTVNGEGSIKYLNGSWTPEGSVDTPVASINTANVFKYDARGQVYGVIGAELVASRFPRVRPLVDTFKETLPDRLAETGVYFKQGFEGGLSVNVEEINSAPCFSWSLQAKAGATAKTKFGSTTLAELASLTNYGPITSGSTGCETLGPSPGGFNLNTLACKKNENGSASITGLYSAGLAPGEQITVAAWSTEYFTGMTTPNACSSPTYAFPDNRQFGIPGEYIASSCTPPDGLSLNPSNFAACHNPLGGTPRNIWTRLKGGVSSTLVNGGSVIVSFCRATTINLNGSIPPGSRPTISIDTTIPCT
jgi:hypothetical protein